VSFSRLIVYHGKTKEGVCICRQPLETWIYFSRSDNHLKVGFTSVEVDLMHKLQL